jgi:hypothetical protein
MCLERPFASAFALALLALPALAQDPAPQQPAPAEPQKKEEEKREGSLFVDPVDGWFDASKFLDSKVGFFPIVMPITEPAVGFGGAAALVFFDAPPRVIQTPRGPRGVWPNTTFVGGLATENGTWGGFGGHMHVWDDGRIRYLGAGGYVSANLDWFGEGNTGSGRSFGYNIEVWMLVQKLTFKLGDSDFFLGPTQRLLSTTTSFDNSANLPPDISGAQLESTVSGLGLSFAYDTRNSMFSPTKGTKTSLDWTQNGGAIGSDFNYAKVALESCNYFPLGGPFTLGFRGDAQYAGEDAPFFDLASIQLRGIQAGRYVDNVALTFEAELRWDVTSRWTVLGFGGLGWLASQISELGDLPSRGAGGFGFRYLVAREYDLRAGLDVAAGPEDTAVYVTIGTGWVRD